MKHSNQNGFTLIEVIIAVTILAILSALTAETIQRTVRMKAKVQTDLDRESMVRNAMRLIEKDINSAFHSRNMLYEMQEDLKKQPAGTAAAPPPNPYAPAEVPPRQFTQFLGNETQLDFTSLNHVRMMKDSQESDQEEVGYFLESCKNRRDEKKVSQCLMRRTSAYIDDDVAKGGAAIALLENVTQFKLRYMGKGKDEWVSSWRTDEQGDAITKDHFPQAVEVTLILKDTKEFGITTVYPIHFPNNTEEAKAPGTTPPPQPGAVK